MNFLEVEGLSKKQEGALAVNNVSFKQQQFEKLAIAGETGSGKSTLLKMIGGLLQPDTGEIYFEENRVLGPEEKLLPGHPAIGYLSQHFELRNNYYVHELLSMALKLETNVAETIFEVCRISHLLQRRTNQLSGGEKQRIATARLLITSPTLLLLDEPYSNLDMVHKKILKEVIRDIGQRLGITCILVSHDPLDLLSWAESIIVMKGGKVIQQGSPMDIYRRPVNDYTAGLFGNYNPVTLSLLNSFVSLRGLEMNRNNFFVRPENFRIVGSENEGVAGFVQEVLFYGGLYELKVLLSDNLITMTTQQNYLKKGDTVYVALVSDGMWRMG